MAFVYGQFVFLKEEVPLKAAIILSGCGVRDGSEIHEAVCLLLALRQSGHSAVCFAPEGVQTLVYDHAAGKIAPETRNMLSEAARIARGDIHSLASLHAQDYDAILLPGGMGAALNLCDFGQKGEHCTVIPELESVLLCAYQHRIPMGFMCIAPVIAARLFKGVRITLGGDCDASKTCEKMGAVHQPCPCDCACIDESFRIVSVPAYMTADDIVGVYQSATALVRAIESF